MTKYGNKKTKCLAGHTHDSKKEAARCDDLMLLFRCGQIHNLEIQHTFPLHVENTRIGAYRADFVYFEGDKRVVEDVKGVRTALYRWKKKHVEAEYRVQIRET